MFSVIQNCLHFHDSFSTSRVMRQRGPMAARASFKQNFVTASWPRLLSYALVRDWYNGCDFVGVSSAYHQPMKDTLTTLHYWIPWKSSTGMAFFADLCYGIPDTADRILLATKSCIQGSFGFILFSTVFDVKLDTEKTHDSRTVCHEAPRCFWAESVF